jgi:ribonucleotide monophosphatase NagD (HAD superfamily)
MTTHRRIETYLMDMDGVLVHEERLIPGPTSSSAASRTAATGSWS